jgi:hypothetical protein
VGDDNFGEFLMNTHLPEPTVQAMFLLDETENDLNTAVELAKMNAREKVVGDIRYWVAVVDALTLKEQEN